MSETNTRLMPALARPTQLRVILALLVVIAPHALRIPIWATALCAGVLLWRYCIATRQWALPGKWLRAGLAIGGMCGVLLQYGSLNGHYPGATLLCLMAALKLTETVKSRDYFVLVILMYFLLTTHFLFTQQIGMIIYLLGSATLTTAVMIELSHPQGPMTPKQTTRMAGTMVLQAVPVMVVLFVLFPRIPGPLWGLPSDSGAQGVTGLSDSMSPGDISNLSQSDKVAFRVRFDDDVPARRDLYWRGPVFEILSGRTWSEWAYPKLADNITARAEPIGYEIVLEPHRKNWLFALDFPTSGSARSLPSGLTRQGQLLSRDDIREQTLYQVTSTLEYTFEPELSRLSSRLNLDLRRTGNPRTRALAEQWRSETPDPRALANRLLRHFNQQEFVYTLQPPALGEESVDDFLFETRRGFCEHYASAFVVFMRAAGVQARVVTGYQGGEPGLGGDYYIVRQSDAHAWAEIWLAGRGWIRYDPTGAVAPDRVELGLAAALPNESLVPQLARRSGAFLQTLQLRWDGVNAAWDRWVLAYGPEVQKDFLGKFGLGRWRQMALALAILITVFLTMIGVALIWQSRPKQSNDHARRLWDKAQRKLGRLGVEARNDEGPLDYARRASNELPTKADEIDTLTAAYIQSRYLSAEHQPEALSALEHAVKTL